MDRIRSVWNYKNRIGDCIHTFEKSRYLDIENKIISVCSKYRIESKFNVNFRIGGIPPATDKKPIVNPDLHAIAYHDVMGGILISSRNAEVTCRNIDRIVETESIDFNQIDVLKQSLKDKYQLSSYNEELPNKVIFLPGSNLRNIVNEMKIKDAIKQYPNIKIKPHPIQTDIGYNKLKTVYKDRLIDKDISGVQLLNNCEKIWFTYNSEIGLIATLKNINVENITNWNNAFSCIYSPLYRKFRDNDSTHNLDVVSKVISSKISGFVFPWQEDWEERIESCINNMVNEHKVGAIFPYIK